MTRSDIPPNLENCVLIRRVHESEILETFWKHVPELCPIWKHALVAAIMTGLTWD